MEDNEKYIIEIRKDYTVDKLAMIQGGSWDTLTDEFGADRVFDYFSQAQRLLQAKCPKIDMFGDNVGRVRKVVMINRKSNDKK
jgi:NADPH-dependent curcumin reductase CurA